MCGQWGPKVHHVYDCNDAPNKDWVKAGAEQLFSDDGRFDWHLERFNNHMGSLVFAESKRAECESKRTLLIESGTPPAQADCLVEAADLLVECRHVCAWTYALAYFVIDEKARKMLQFAQKDLETYTEQMSAMVERQTVHQIMSNLGSIRAHMAALTKFKSAMVRSGRATMPAPVPAARARPAAEPCCRDHHLDACALAAGGVDPAAGHSARNRRRDPRSPQAVQGHRRCDNGWGASESGGSQEACAQGWSEAVTPCGC